MIKIVVGQGEAKVEHFVHKSVLLKCPFFEKCLNSGMKEAQESVVELPEDNPNDIDLLIIWLYQDKMIPTSLSLKQTVSAYNMAEKYGLPALKLALVDQRRPANWTESMDPEDVLYIWQSTTDGCELRKYALDQLNHDIWRNPEKYLKSKGVPGFDGCFEAALQGLMAQDGVLAYALYKKRAEVKVPGEYVIIRDSSHLSGCVYHDHESVAARDECTASQGKQRQS